MRDMENAKPILAAHEKDLQKYGERLDRIEKAFKDNPEKLPSLDPLPKLPVAPTPKPQSGSPPGSQ
jgi:hypothetical protein